MTAKIGSFDDLLAMTEPALHPVAIRLREIILAVHPQAVEVVRLGDRAACFGYGPKKMSEAYVYILPHKNWVNLGFFQGASLADPEGLLEGTGQSMRHIKIKRLEDTARPGVVELITAAKLERAQALGL